MKYRQMLLRSAVIVPLALGIGCNGKDNDTRVDTSAYLKAICESTNQHPDRANYEIDLTKGKQIKVDDFVLTSEGNGRIHTYIYTGDNNDTDKNLSSDQDSIYVKERGIEFRVQTKPVDETTTHISVSRSCEKR